MSWAAVPWWRWVSLILFSGLLSGLLLMLHLPAGVLLGCMAAGMAVSIKLGTLTVSKPLFSVAQGVLGCLMAQSMQPAALTQVLAHWPLFLGINLLVISAGGLLGWWLVRRRVLPGTTALWGIAPGAASAMVLMAEGFGADVRLVAFMQYTRVLIVTGVAALVAHVAMTAGASLSIPVHQQVMHDNGHLAGTLAVIGIAAVLAQGLKIPAGGLVVALLGATSLQAIGLLVIELPATLLMMAYAVIGWSVGLRFTAEILAYAWRALPTVLMAIVALIGLGVTLATGLVWGSGLEPLTAYLATSPGGADSVAVIAATSAVDAGFVMAMQLVRFLMVLMIGPAVTRWIARRT